MPLGQETTIGLRVPPKWEATSLVALERRAARPGPAGVIHVVGLGRAEGVEPADLFQRRELLLDGVGDVVLREQFADRSLLAFGARAVVAEDVEDERVFAQPALFEPVDQPADLGVGVLDEAGEDLHQAASGRRAGPRGCLSQAAMVSSRGVSLVPGGMMPISSWRLKTRSR